MNKLSELKVTIPADKKSRESVAAGYVTDNNSGGYFVIECQECGAVYPSQQADGGGQIADTGDYNDAICPHCGEEGPEECENVGLAWNVQQAKIIALLAELEREIEMRAQNLEIKTLLAEKVKGLETKLWYSQQLVDAKSSSQIELRSQISSLEERNRKDMAWRGERLCELEDSLEAAEKRIAELERANQSQDDHINQQQDRIDSLEKTNSSLGRGLAAAEKRLATPVRLSKTTHPRCRQQHASDIRAAGFTVEGDGE